MNSIESFKKGLVYLKDLTPDHEHYEPALEKLVRMLDIDPVLEYAAMLQKKLWSKEAAAIEAAKPKMSVACERTANMIQSKNKSRDWSSCIKQAQALHGETPEKPEQPVSTDTC